MRFEEKILYRSRQHWIVPLSKSLSMIGFVAIPLSFVTYFITDYSILSAVMTCLFIGAIGGGYYIYLWYHSWLMVGNQKITMTVRNGIFSHFAMNIRYRNIRDCAVSKSNIWSFFFRYGTLFIRSSGAEGDFSAYFVPKVGKVYALINALSRYSDEDRESLSTIEELHNHHQSREFSSHTTSVDRHG